MRWLWLLLLFAPQERRGEVEFKWGFPKDKAADYAVSDWRGGRAVPRKDKFFLLYGAELTAEGGNSLILNSYSDLGPKFLFRLPPGRVKPGSRWNIEETLFLDARLALTPSHDFDERRLVGVGQYLKNEKVQDRDCAVVEARGTLWEVKFEKDKRLLGKKPIASLSTMQWLSLEETMLVKGVWSFSGEAQEFKGIKQGEEPRRTKMDLAEHLELRKGAIELDLRAHGDAIKKAIQRGVAWLRTRQKHNGSFVDEGGSFARDFPVGSTALCVMALLHSGVKADDPAIRKGFAYVTGEPFRKTYDVATTLMLYETKYLPLEQIEDVQALDEAKAKELIRKSIMPEDKAFVQKAVDWLVEKQTRGGTWGYPEMSEYFDHSNTQYALLGLKSAARMGIAVRPDTWKRIAEHWMLSQRMTGGKKSALRLEFFDEKDAGISGTKSDEEVEPGAWGYFTAKPGGFGAEITDQGYGSMTCAGLTSLIIAESELAAAKELDDGLRRRIDSAKKQGLAWLQQNYTVRGCPPAAGFWSVFHLYYLYSLERVGVLYGIRRLDGHDWYLEGAILLVRYQREDGSWVSYDEIPILDSAFALLFLKKATMRVSTK